MENEKYPIWKHSLTYGIFLSIVMIVFTLVLYLLNMSTEKWPRYINFIFILAGVIMAAVAYKNKYQSGFITYSQSLTVGFMTGLFAAIISSVFTFLFISYLGEAYIADLLEIAEEEMLASSPDLSDEELDMALNFSRKLMNPLWITIISFFSTVFFSLLFALIGSIFIKKEQPLV
jgi:hypothetical protein